MCGAATDPPSFRPAVTSRASSNVAKCHAANDDGYEKVFVGKATVNNWLPGSIELFTEEFFKQPADLPPGEIHDIADTIALPKDIPAGGYTVSVGVVGVVTAQAVVQLGIQGRDEDGWYPVAEAGRKQVRQTMIVAIDRSWLDLTGIICGPSR